MNLFTTTKFGIPLIGLILVVSSVVGISATSGYIMLKVHSGDEVNIFGYVLKPKEKNITLNAFVVDKHGNKLDMNGSVKIFFDDGNTKEVLDNEDSLVRIVNIKNGNVTTEVSKEGTYFVEYTDFGNYSINYTAVYTDEEAPSLVRELNVNVNAHNISCTTEMAGPMCDGGIINGTVSDWNNSKIHGADVEVRVSETGEILQDTTTTGGHFEVQVTDVPDCDWSGTEHLMHVDVYVSYSGFEKHTNTTFYASNQCLL